MIMITLPGNPIALKRPRFFKGNVFNSQEKEMEETFWDIKWQMPKNIYGSSIAPLAGPLKVHIVFYMPIPPSTPKPKKLRMSGQLHTKRPDIDNMIKWVLDCGNVAAWADDSIICHLSALKVYDSSPRTVITIEEIGVANGQAD